jgi:hypothetical protein
MLGGSKLLKLQIISVEHSLHGVAKQIRVLALIETPAHFVQIRLQLFCTNTMPLSNEVGLILSSFSNQKEDKCQPSRYTGPTAR